ncbi:hypothetical protein HYH03_003678 [Edaphochlamys debaryana]|uniref:Mitochondrial ribonuclease P catalytic subunit n=1 Tax=Edaphochlamys debaryana TaxID=47281 RepID=A0A835Y8V5_9CHLO|nr:hypothetical protein HYH03_003678 [Edaphochlamys debaryana]|eukprot:KAG2498420.1 hypothetical protein HYH03_003678 [Edaphochlamys debaryana]
MSGSEEPAKAEPLAKRQKTGDGPATNGAAQDGAGPQGGDGGGKKGGKRNQDAGRIAVLHQAIKMNNLQYGMTTFREMVADGLSVPTGVINNLLYLAAGSEQWERYARGQPPLPPPEVPAEAPQEEPEQPAEAGKKQKGGKRKPPQVPAPTGPPPSREELVAAVDELWAHMGAKGLQPDAGTYLGLARREALRGNPDAALKWAKESIAKRHHVQLRLLHPAQVGYCLAGNVEALEGIDGLISRELKLDSTEYEYARLLEGLAAAPEGGASYEKLQAILLRMQSDLTTLSPETADIVATCLTRPEAAAAAEAAARAAAAAAAAAPAAEGAEAAVEGAPAAEAAPAAEPVAEGGWRWRVERGVAVEEGGRCEAAGGTLALIDLEDEDWERFAAAIANLARSNMGGRAKDFDAFAEWYDRNGPYDVLVDAANVAFFGQNHEGGGFSWPQIQAMHGLLTARFPAKKILVMLHCKRLNDAGANTPTVKRFLEGLRKARSFYYTPPGANDDWFWLYACVKAKRAGLLISNDLLRDHIFSLLRPKHFLKWKERHIANYAYATPYGAVSSYDEDGDRWGESKGAGAGGAGGGGGAGGSVFELQLPTPYTACVQQVRESGAWMLPVGDGGWVCVRPERAG